MLDSRIIQIMPIVAARYNEPNRHYHNWSHIVQMFDEIKKFNLELTFAQYTAILFHDFVYMPGSDTNERDSSTTMYAIAKDIIPSLVLHTASAIIIDTRDHIPVHRSSPEVLDLDMSILGLADVRGEYDENIRKEYSQYSDAQFYKGRRVFLEELLSRSTIFYTPKMHNAYEDKARQYIKRSIDYIDSIYPGVSK